MQGFPSRVGTLCRFSQALTVLLLIVYVGFQPEIGEAGSVLGAGLGHSLVIKPDGSLWACGNKTYGQIGGESHGSAQLREIRCQFYFGRTHPTRIPIQPRDKRQAKIRCRKSSLCAKQGAWHDDITESQRSLNKGVL